MYANNVQMHMQILKAVGDIEIDTSLFISTKDLISKY